MYSIDAESGCWNWSGSINPNGYGIFHIGKTSKCAHRYVYEKEIDSIPIGFELDHLCRNRGCVNPKHLEPVTRSENMLRASKFFSRVISFYCKYGHLLDGVRTRGIGGRYCKTCVKLNKRKQRSLNKPRKDED